MILPTKITAAVLVLAIFFGFVGFGFATIVFPRQAEAATTGDVGKKIAASVAACFTTSLVEIGAGKAASYLLGGAVSAVASELGLFVPSADATHTAVTSSQSTMDMIQTAWTNSKDCQRDLVVKKLLDWIVDTTVEAIQNGGKPRFVTDWKGFMNDAYDNALGEFISDKLGGADLCAPFSVQLRVAFNPVPKFAKRTKCTLSKIVKNMSTFYFDFKKGGWPAYRASWETKNNFYGLYLVANDELVNDALQKVNAAAAEADTGKGFLSHKKCVQYDLQDNKKCLKWEIVTPGDTIGAMAADAVTSDAQWARNVKSWTAAIYNAIINRLFKDGFSKMKKSTDPSADSSGDFDPSQGTAYDPIIDYQSVTQSDFGKLQLCSSQTGGGGDQCFEDMKKEKCEPFVASARQSAGFRLAVDSQGTVGAHSSIRALDANTIFIAYEDATNRDLKLAVSMNGGQSWIPQTVDATSGVGAFTSVDASSNAIAIAYRDETNGTVKIAHSANLGATWMIKTIDAVGIPGFRPSVKLAAPTGVLASYYDATNKDLKLARTSNGGLTWATSTVVSLGDIGYYSSLDAVGNTVFIAYRDATNQNLKLAKSTDGGFTWTVRTIDSSENVGAFVSLRATDQNTVFVAYYDEMSANLKFARSDNGGLSWSVKTIDSPGDVGQYLSLAPLDKNRIYVSYYDATNQNLRLAKSTDGGNSWETIVADPTRYNGRYSSLAMIDEKTALISYYDEANADLKFAKADPTVKSETGAPTTSDPDRKAKCEASIDRLKQETRDAQRVMCQTQGGTWTGKGEAAQQTKTTVTAEELVPNKAQFMLGCITSLLPIVGGNVILATAQCEPQYIFMIGVACKNAGGELFPNGCQITKTTTTTSSSGGECQFPKPKTAGGEGGGNGELCGGAWCFADEATCLDNQNNSNPAYAIGISCNNDDAAQKSQTAQYGGSQCSPGSWWFTYAQC
ncbi:MAG: exo-alpha-sialidase [Parcubacteria group bacterium]|nr:exo-alpha-sialidase [Parcubacteria group bacterium]